MIHGIVAVEREKERILQEKESVEQEEQQYVEEEEEIRSEHEQEFDMWAELNDHQEPINLAEQSQFITKKLKQLKFRQKKNITWLRRESKRSLNFQSQQNTPYKPLQKQNSFEKIFQIVSPPLLSPDRMPYHSRISNLSMNAGSLMSLRPRKKSILGASPKSLRGKYSRKSFNF